jgi:alkylhydroperoxidase family enzyme
MARVSYVEPQNAPPEVKKIYDQKLKGHPGNIQKALAHRPELLDSFLTFYGSVGKSLDKRLYELIYIRVSTINGCNY